MIDLRQERYESVPEFIREPHVQTRERAGASITSSFRRDVRRDKTTKKSTAYDAAYDDLEFEKLDEEFAHPKSAELETLWPGVDHDLLHVSHRGPSFYLTLGFLAGAITSLFGIWIYAWLTHSCVAPVSAVESARKMVVTVASASSSNAYNRSRAGVKAAGGNAEVTTLVPVDSNAELVVPAFSTYEVRSGDTLAMIAVKAYHRVSPRLLDAICTANGMRSADVLTLEQRLVLPEYRPRVNQLQPGA